MAIAAVLTLCFIALGSVAGDPLYNVVSYGAVGDGKSDDTRAFSKAWGAACADSSHPTLLVPSKKTFLLSQTTFQGQCKSRIRVQVDGNIVAPNTRWTDKMIAFLQFQNVNNLIVKGSGEIDGRGSVWWACANKGCPLRPDLLGFHACNNASVGEITIKNSPGKQMKIHESVQFHVNGIKVIAPGNSPNTDGIFVSHSRLVKITGCHIATGDDCIAIGTGTSDIEVAHITCGPSHGISVGSLGPNSAVDRVHVSDCQISQSMTGVRIKTWQGGSGHAKDITFERINFTSVQTAIVIDQSYCPHEQCIQKAATNVAISKVQYIDLHGSCSQKEAIHIQCDRKVPCDDILMKNVNLKQEQSKGPATAVINNAHVRTIGTVIPKRSFLNQSE